MFNRSRKSNNSNLLIFIIVKVLIASDKYKGSLSAQQVCFTIREHLPKAYSSTILPLADGGDGSLEIIQQYLSGDSICLESIDALGRAIDITYLKAEGTAFIELAEISGMARLSPHEYDVMNTTSIGTGKAILHAIDSGVSEVVLFLGGSSTHDVGLGILYGLGFRFENSQGEEVIPSAGTLSEIAAIVSPPNVPEVHIRLIADVTNTICGSKGAHIYTPQKGASSTQQKQIAKDTEKLVLLLERHSHKSLFNIIGGGATGGIPIGILALWPHATIEKGFSFMNRILNIEQQVHKADLVITGEGKVDATSLSGKVVGSILKLCETSKKPCIIITGSATEEIRLKVQSPLHALTDVAPLEQCLSQPQETLEKLLNSIDWPMA